MDIRLEFEGKKIYISPYSLDKYLAIEKITKNEKKFDKIYIIGDNEVAKTKKNWKNSLKIQSFGVSNCNLKYLQMCSYSSNKKYPQDILQILGYINKL